MVPGSESRVTVARNAFHLVLGQAATMVLGIFLSAALGRLLGAKDFGTYYLLTMMANFAYVFVEWGQTLFVMREVAREPMRAGGLLGTALAMRVSLAAAVTLPTAAIVWALGYGAATTWLAALMMVACLPNSLAMGYGMVFRARDHMGRDATVTVAAKVMTLGLTLPVLFLGGGVPGVILAQGAAGAGALGFAARLYRALKSPPLMVSSQTARELLKFGTPILAMTAATSVQPYLDAIILSKLAPANVVGWFGAARSILLTITAPAVILATAAYPRLARSSSNPAALRREVRAALRPLLWLGALGATGTYLFASTAIGLIYGTEGYGPAVDILAAFAPAVPVLFVDILLGNTLYAAGRGTGFAIAKIASVGVVAALDFLLIPLFQARFGNGGIGVVVAFALGEIVVFAGGAMALGRGTLGAATLIDIARALAAAGMTGLLFLLLPPLSPWIGIPLCVGAFTVASAGVGLMTRRDLDLLRELANRQRAGAERPA